MPVKSKHGKGKHPHRSKKSKAIRRQSAENVRHDVGDQTNTPVDIAKPTIPKSTTVSEKTITMQYPFIANELRRIGILAGIILVILILLAVSLT